MSEKSMTTREKHINILKDDPCDVVGINNLPAEDKDFLFVFAKLAILKGVDIQPEQQAAIINELKNSFSYTKAHLLNAFEKIKALTLYGNRIDIEMFMPSQEDMRIHKRVVQQAALMVHNGIEQYKYGLSDHDKALIRREVLTKYQQAYEIEKEAFIESVREEFMGAIYLDSGRLNIISVDKMNDVYRNIDALTKKMTMPKKGGGDVQST